MSAEGRIEARKIQAVIPPKTNRVEQRSCDWYLYKERHAVECLFSKLKYYRRIAIRFETFWEESLSFQVNAGLRCCSAVVMLIRQQSLVCSPRPWTALLAA
ncbi:hypothetical protein D3879_22515 [Pseudomonas cavernicola]|uniref:Transposase DDE domain-containing protein n=1 Tax=Pseudomonas cavernicola TaxID=2320866 RepID=A0A418X861_9PSED|nr:hypothetical protein D3879_22515 [Pseudomonas cavernicola]